MNYNSINELLSAGTSNMTKEFGENWGVKTVSGVDWFVFDGVVVSEIYVGGYSYFGLGSNTAHLKVNRRSDDVHCLQQALYREEGTLYNKYRFLKLRWEGYPFYSGITGAYRFSYEVFLWDTGDISLSMKSVPKYNDGEYSLTTASKTYTYKISSSSLNVTFANENNEFIVENKAIELYERRYLIRSDETYYTVVDNALSEVAIEELTSEVFLTFGSMTLPAIDMTFDLPNPEILYWSEDPQIAHNVQLAVSFTPPLPQLVYSESYTIQDGMVLDKIVILDAKNTLISVTFDNGATWRHYQDGTWVETESETDGMTADILNNLSAGQLAETMPYTTFQVRCSLISLNSAVGELYFNLVPTTTEA